MSVLCLVQAVFLFAIVMGLLSVFMLRYSGYQPVQKLLEQDGFLTDMVSSVHLEGDAEGRPVQSSEAYEEMLKNAEVYGQYKVSAFAGENQEIAEKREEGSYFSNVRAYDDEWLQGFVPKLQSGRWLKTENTEGRWLEAVVLQSRDTYKVGDVEYLDSNSETKLKTRIPVKIVGIIDRNSDIIYQSNRSGSVDYHMLFSNMAGETENLDEISYIDNMTCFIPETFFVSKKNLDSVQEQYVSLEAEENLSENYENVLRTEKTIFRTELNGVVMIVMKQNSSTEALAYNRNRIAQISQFDFLHDLSYIKKNTWHNIMANISDMIPIGAGMILFTMISFVTLSTLMYQKNMRKYSIYYMYGLTWRNIFWIHILYISLIALAALALGMVLLYGAGYFGIWKAAAVQLGAVQLVGCLMVLLLLLLSASLMCISLVRGRTAKKILQEVE
jgi:ABC-type multidrug transport system permease subunit